MKVKQSTLSRKFIQECADMCKRLSDYTYPSTYDKLLEDWDEKRDDGWDPVFVCTEYEDGSVYMSVDVICYDA